MEGGVVVMTDEVQGLHPASMRSRIIYNFVEQSKASTQSSGN